MQSSSLDPRFALPQTICFVIGAQKAGTTWIQSHFLDHPQVCVPGLKEVNYWNTVRFPFQARVRQSQIGIRAPWILSLRHLCSTPSLRRKDRAKQLTFLMERGSTSGVHDGYADVMFDRYRNEPLLAEVNPQYALLQADTFREMAALSGDVRFVFILRDPLGRIHSRLNQKIGKAARPWAAPTPAAIRSAYETMLAAGADSDIIRRSAYDRTLRELETAVPAEQRALFFYETFFQPDEQERFSRFLGITHIAAKVERRVLKSKASVRDFPKDLDARALALLRPTYETIAARFGDQLPGAWRRSMAKLDADPPLPPAAIDAPTA